MSKDLGEGLGCAAMILAFAFFCMVTGTCNGRFVAPVNVNCPPTGSAR